MLWCSSRLDRAPCANVSHLGRLTWELIRTRSAPLNIDALHLPVAQLAVCGSATMQRPSTRPSVRPAVVLCIGLAVGLAIGLSGLPQQLGAGSGAAASSRRLALASDGQHNLRPNFRPAACSGQVAAGPALNGSRWVAPQRSQPLPRFNPEGCCRCGGHRALRSILALPRDASSLWPSKQSFPLDCLCAKRTRTAHVHTPPATALPCCRCRDRYALLDALRRQGFAGWAAELGVAAGGYSREILRRTEFAQVFSVDM